MKHIFNVHKGETFFNTSDLGWIIGHSFTCYGSLLTGATTILSEGRA